MPTKVYRTFTANPDRVTSAVSVSTAYGDAQFENKGSSFETDDAEFADSLAASPFLVEGDQRTEEVDDDDTSPRAVVQDDDPQARVDAVVAERAETAAQKRERAEDPGAAVVPDESTEEHEELAADPADVERAHRERDDY